MPWSPCNARSLFPDGIVFLPVPAGHRDVFEGARTPPLDGSDIFRGDPTVDLRKVTLAEPFAVVALRAARPTVWSLAIQPD
jgi:hypothetical protein